MTTPQAGLQHSAPSEGPASFSNAGRPRQVLHTSLPVNGCRSRHFCLPLRMSCRYCFTFLRRKPRAEPRGHSRNSPAAAEKGSGARCLDSRRLDSGRTEVLGCGQHGGWGVLTPLPVLRKRTRAPPGLTDTREMLGPQLRTQLWSPLPPSRAGSQDAAKATPGWGVKGPGRRQLAAKGSFVPVNHSPHGNARPRPGGQRSRSPASCWATSLLKKPGRNCWHLQARWWGEHPIPGKVQLLLPLRKVGRSVAGAAAAWASERTAARLR